MTGGKNGNEKSSKILFGILWTFRGKKYRSKEKFSREIKQYQIRITGKDTWKPDEIVIKKPQIEILLERDWEYPPDDKIEFTLESENSKNFTALDLLFQLNNILAGCDLGDNRFFEGLRFNSESGQYVLKLGS